MVGACVGDVFFHLYVGSVPSLLGGYFSFKPRVVVVYANKSCRI